MRFERRGKIVGVAVLACAGIVAGAVLAGAAAPAPDAPGAIAGKVSGPDSGRPWVVYVEKVAAAAVSPAAKRVEIVQKDRKFMPGAVVVRVGAAVDFPNRDKFYHNVFSPTPGSEFDLGLYRDGASKSAVFKKAGEVDVYCNIHPEMVAKVLVVEHDFFVEVGADATYRIAGLPPGSYTTIAWSPTLEPERRTVDVKPGAETKADWAITRPRAPGSHLKKDGSAYGRYK
jgi:plastocyanin